MLYNIFNAQYRNIMNLGLEAAKGVVLFLAQ